MHDFGAQLSSTSGAKRAKSLIWTQLRLLREATSGRWLPAPGAPAIPLTIFELGVSPRSEVAPRGRP